MRHAALPAVARVKIGAALRSEAIAQATEDNTTFTFTRDLALMATSCHLTLP